MAPRYAWLGLLTLLLAFVALAALYIATIPYFASTDEVHHFEYVRLFLGEGRLPAVTEAGQWAAELHQPPLYYAMAAALGKVVLASPLQGIDGVSRMTLVFYTDRALSAFFGLLAVAGTYLLVRQLVPDRRGFALGTAALVAFTPTFLALSSAVSNDILAAALGSFLLSAMVAYLRRPEAWGLLPLAGALLGLGALTKENLPPLALPLAGAIAFQAWRRCSAKYLIGALALAYIPALALGGWWYVRNWALYGDPLALGLLERLNPSLVLPQPPGLASYPDLLGSVWQTFWIAFGPISEVRADRAVYLAIAAFLLLSLVGLGSFLLRSRRELADLALVPSLALLTGAIGLELVVVLRHHRYLIGAGHGRYFYPAVAAVAVLVALGLYQLLPRYRPLPVGGFAAFLLALALASPFVYIAPLQARPSLVSQDQLWQEARPVDALFAEGARLVGYSIDTTRVKPGQELVVTLYWQGVADMDTNWTAYVHLMDTRHDLYAQYDSIPLQERYPTLFWQRGPVWKETYRLKVKESAPGGLHRLEVGFYDLATGRHAPVSAQGHSWVGGLLLGQVKVVNPIPRPEPRHATDIGFQDGIRLIGWDWDRGQVTLYWQATGPPSRAYTTFAHLLDPAGTLVAQHDGTPAAGAMPTELWEAGEFIIDEHPISAWPGVYLLEVGAYDPATGRRLPRQQGGDSAILGRVENKGIELP